jgi:putative peptidoglycan lipid II flippase
MISSVLILAPRMGARLDQQIYGLAIGVLIAGAVQAAFQLPALRKEGFRFAWVSPWKDPTVREVVRKMLPGSIGVAAFQINVLVTQTFSYWVEESIVSTFNYAVRLLELPQGMFGISLATFMLPALSGLAAEKKFHEFRDTLRQGLSHLAVANLFSAAVAFALAEPIVRLLFERGLFTSTATHRVAVALACLAPGLLMFSMNNILARAFYALGDIRTPMQISVFCLIVNLITSLVLVFPLREAGLGIANTCTALLNTGLLTYALRRKLKFLGFSPLVKSFAGLATAAVLAAAAAAAGYNLWERHLGHGTLLLKLGAVFAPGALAALVYWATGLLLKVPGLTNATHAVLLRLRR